MSLLLFDAFFCVFVWVFWLLSVERRKARQGIVRKCAEGATSHGEMHPFGRPTADCWSECGPKAAMAEPWLVKQRGVSKVQADVWCLLVCEVMPLRNTALT